LIDRRERGQVRPAHLGKHAIAQGRQPKAIGDALAIYFAAHHPDSKKPHQFIFGGTLRKGLPGQATFMGALTGKLGHREAALGHRSKPRRFNRPKAHRSHRPFDYLKVEIHQSLS
jgi:hypothetical protein